MTRLEFVAVVTEEGFTSAYAGAQWDHHFGPGVEESDDVCPHWAREAAREVRRAVHADRATEGHYVAEGFLPEPIVSP